MGLCVKCGKSEGDLYCVHYGNMVDKKTGIRPDASGGSIIVTEMAFKEEGSKTYPVCKKCVSQAAREHAGKRFLSGSSGLIFGLLLLAGVITVFIVLPKGSGLPFWVVCAFWSNCAVGIASLYLIFKGSKVPAKDRQQFGEEIAKTNGWMKDESLKSQYDRCWTTSEQVEWILSGRILKK